MKFSITAIDTETHLIPPSGKVRTAPVGPPLVITTVSAASILGSFRNEYILYDDPAADLKIKQYIEDSDYIVFHNATFDISVLSKAYPSLKQVFIKKLSKYEILDTRVMFALRWPAYSDRYSLKNLVKELFNVELEKGAVRTSFRQGQTLTEEQIHYAMQDAIYTRRAAAVLLETQYGGMVPPAVFFISHDVWADTSHVKDEILPDKIFSVSAGWQAFNVEEIGLEVDKPRLERFHDDAKVVCEEHFGALYRHGLAKATRDRTAKILVVGLVSSASLPRKWTYAEVCGHMYRGHKGELQRCAVKWVLDEKALRAAYSEFANNNAIDAPISEKTEALSLEYEFWKQYQGDLPEGLQTHLALGKQRKLLSTYFAPMMACGGQRLVVHPNIGVAFAETGRWTCWKPNLQNQPKSVRNMYKSPRQGDVLVTADYKSLEMYTACECLHRLGIRNGPLRQILDAEGDIHENTAKLLFDDCTPELRKIAKMCNFALLGGMGVTKFLRKARASGFSWNYDKAEQIRSRWFTALEDCAEFLDLFRIDPWTLRPCNYNKRGWLDLLKIPYDPWPSKWELGQQVNEGRIFNVRLPDGRVIPNRRFSQAANIFFQGMGADVVSHAFNRVCACGIPVCIVVHDSITISAPPEDADRYGMVLVTCMQEAQEELLSCGVKIPLPTYEIGEFWS